MATTTAITSALTTNTISAVTPSIVSTTPLATTSSLIGTVTTDLTLTSTALVSQSITPIISATTTFSVATTPLFDTSSTLVFSSTTLPIFSAPVASSQISNPPEPSHNSPPASSPANLDATNLKPATIAGIAIGGGALVLLIALGSLCICLARRRKLRKNPPKANPITFLTHSSSRATEEEDVEKSRSSSRTQEIEEPSRAMTVKRSMGGSTLMPPPSDRATGEGFGWKPQAAEHLQESAAPQNRPFSWMQQDQDAYLASPEQAFSGSVPWRPASELLGQPIARTGSPFSLPTNAMRGSGPSQDSLSFSPGYANRQSAHSDLLRSQIKRAFNDGGRHSNGYVSSPLSEPANSKWRSSEMGSLIDDNLDTNSTFSGETLGKLRKEHDRIQTERTRISRLQQLDEEEDWIRHQIANAETRRGSAISRVNNM